LALWPGFLKCLVLEVRWDALEGKMHVGVGCINIEGWYTFCFIMHPLECDNFKIEVGACDCGDDDDH
jgi:hypothetical protein